jgi:hypothetical protein
MGKEVVLKRSEFKYLCQNTPGISKQRASSQRLISDPSFFCTKCTLREAAKRFTHFQMVYYSWSHVAHRY